MSLSFTSEEGKNLLEYDSKERRKPEVSNGLVFKVLDSQSRDPVFKSTG